VQIQVLSKSKFYPSVLLGAQKFMKGKKLHTHLFQIKSNFFQSSTCIQPASTTAGQQVILFQKEGTGRDILAVNQQLQLSKMAKNLF
jgi:hypothetical protein